MPAPPIFGLCYSTRVAPVELILVDTSSAVIFIDTSVSIHLGRKFISAAAIDDHMVMIDKTGVGPLVY